MIVLYESRTVSVVVVIISSSELVAGLVSPEDGWRPRVGELIVVFL